MSNDRQGPARPEQPDEGGFQRPSSENPDEKRIGSFGGAERTARDAHVGQFSDGNESEADKTREGRFSDSIDSSDV